MALKINDNGITREMTEEEETEHKACAQQSLANQKAQAEAQAAKQAARQAVLDKLGLTADEAAALFG